MTSYHDSCCAQIKQINDTLEKFANNRLRENNVTLTQIAVLVEINASTEKTRSLKWLERKFGVAQPTMVGIVKRLEEKGLVETMFSPDDNRVKLVSITDAGESKCELGYEYMDFSENTLLSALDDDEQAEFRRLLTKIKDHFGEIDD